MLARILTSVAFFVATAFAVLLASNEPGLGQDKATKKAMKKAEKAAKQAAEQELNGQEATILRKAYILLTAANFNYDGHKAKAMAEVKDACEILDKRIVANGTAAQEAATLRQDALTAYIKANRSLAGNVTEPQVISDAQVFQAGVLLDNLRVVMAARNQPKLKAHVEKAIAELKLALAVKR